jgi:hypothetical protein
MLLKKLSFSLFLVSLTQAAPAFGDSFIDLGLNWTQWLPKSGSVQKFQRDEGNAVLSVPSPRQSWRTFASDSGYFPGLPSQPVTPPAPEPVTQLPVSQPVTTQQPPVLSTPARVEPVYTEPAVQAPVTQPQPVVAPQVQVQPVFAAQPVVASPAQFSAMSSNSSRYDALIRMDSGPFVTSSYLVSGTPQAWYQSPVVQKVYGGTPNADQQRTFEQAILNKVQQTYNNSGVPVNLTTDPNANANKTISVVSGASFGQNRDVAGITEINGSGYSFIDKLDNVNNLNDLEWAVARNVAHELMHSFGVEHHDTTGQYLDSAVANWEMLLDPNTKFSQAAVNDLLTNISNPSGSGDQPDAYGFLGQHISECSCHRNYQAQLLSPQPVPEPATVIVWGLLGIGAFVAQKHRRRCISAE